MTSTPEINITRPDTDHDNPTGGAAGSLLDRPPPELEARTAATSLRNALRLNGEFSLLTGIVAAAAAGPIANLFDVDQTWIIRSLGVALIGFGISLFLIAGQRTSLVRSLAPSISVADIGWVIGTAAVIGLGWVSTAGAITTALLAVLVADFAIMQLKAWRRLTTAQADGGMGRGASVALAIDEFPPIELVQVSRSMPVSAARLWPVMTDHQLYAKLALNLKAAEGLTPDGPGFERSCTDGNGRSWSETCTLWQPGRRFDIAVDTTPEDYPYPLRTMHGSWAVDPAASAIDSATDDATNRATDDRVDTAGERSTVSMGFAFQPKPGLMGRLFVPVMHLMFRPILRRILTGWERAAMA